MYKYSNTLKGAKERLASLQDTLKHMTSKKTKQRGDKEFVALLKIKIRKAKAEVKNWKD